MDYNKLINKIVAIIKKNGFPSNLKNIKVQRVKNYDEFKIEAMRIIKSYHKHSFLMTDNKKPIDVKNQKLPKLSYDKKSKTGTIKFYHFFGINKKKEKEMIKLVKKEFSKWEKDGIKKIIIDLADHIGGNMWPAVKALYPIIGDTSLFAWDKEKVSKTSKKWTNFKNGKLVLGELKTKLKFDGNIKVVVSKDTCSSGELIASIFVGRKNAKIVGPKTSGYMSINNGYKVADNIYIILTIMRVTTVDGRFWKDEILT